MVGGLPSSLGHFGNVKTYDQLVLSGMVCCSQLLTDSLTTFAAWGLQTISALYLMREDCKQAIWYMRCVTFLRRRLLLLLLLSNSSIYLFIYLATPRGTWDLNSPTTDHLLPWQAESWPLGPLGKSQDMSLFLQSSHVQGFGLACGFRW